MMMDKPPRSRPVVAILGGGLAGAATALHLARTLAPGSAEIVVIEPRESLGGGLAYSSNEPAHRINVPASKMTVISEVPDDFMNWLAEERVVMSPGTLTPRGDYYPERRVFGRYVASRLAPTLETGAVEHRRTFAVSVERSGGRFLVDLADGSSIGADFVVLAMTHPAPAVPRVLAGLAASPRLVVDPYDNSRISALVGTPRILIVGTGLTSADIVASLNRQGHRGHVTALSRHGLRSRGHGASAEKSTADFAEVPARTATALLRRVRAAIAAEARRGETWHATLDRVREQGQPIWAALSPVERQRLVRHLRTFWDVHRFRIAPQVEEAVEVERRVGRLDTIAARLVSARELPDGIEVTYRPRGEPETRTAVFDAVVVTTGPDHAAVMRSNPVFRSLSSAGLLGPDPNGLGLHVTEQCRTVAADGTASESLLVAGPLARGDVGELMGVPEVTRHAEFVASVLAPRLARQGVSGRDDKLQRAV